MLGMDHGCRLMYVLCGNHETACHDSPLLFVFSYIVNHFGLAIAIDLVRAVDFESVEILGKIMQFPCWMLRLKQHA